jgi:release factor glutamine methyltransferase
VRIITPPGVFRPLSDTRLLAEYARRLAPGADVLELCAGSGHVAIDLALQGARRVTAVDLSRRAVLTCRLNARLNGVALHVRRGDLFAAVRAERFDLVVANPPYVPGDRLPSHGPARGWEGGPDGRLILDRLCAEAPAHLRPGGTVLVVHSSVCGESATLETLAAGGLDARVLARRPGPLGPLLSARAAELARRGLLSDGAAGEELLVIAGRRARSRPRRAHRRAAATPSVPMRPV